MFCKQLLQHLIVSCGSNFELQFHVGFSTPIVYCLSLSLSSSLSAFRASPPQGPILGQDAKGQGQALWSARLEGRQREDQGRAHENEFYTRQVKGPGCFLTQPQFQSF